MAPIQPAQSRPSNKPTYSLDKTSHRISKAPSKRTKRISKHTALLSRISRNHLIPHAVVKTPNRRRPSKKLVTTLDSLAEALPTSPLLTTTANDNDDGGAQHAHTLRPHSQDQKIVHKSLKTRPGARKKKEKLVAMERERFAKNLAEMAKGPRNTGFYGEGGERDMAVEGEKERKEGKAGSADRWAAIRGFIEGRMEQNGVREREAVMGKI